MKKENGITLVALVISIIILLILATVSISLVINNGILDKAKSAVDKYSDGEVEEQIKLAYSEYQNAIWEGTEKNRTEFLQEKLIIVLNDEKIIVRESKDTISVYLSNGKLYEYNVGTGKIQNTTVIKISSQKEDSYVGYYADIDADGTVDGMIFADLLTGSIRDTQSVNYSYGKVIYSLPKNVTKNNVKNYYISRESYTDVKLGTHPVISPREGNGEKRFYIMELRNFSSPAYVDQNDSSKNYPAYSAYYWYYNAGGGKLKASDTSVSFGTGRENTKRMIDIWNLNGEKGGYDGATQNKQDIWKHIQTKYNDGWFIPSRDEMAAIVNELGITCSEYNSKYCFGRDNWTSSISGSAPWSLTFYFNPPTFIGHWGVTNRMDVRLITSY